MSSSHGFFKEFGRSIISNKSIIWIMTKSDFKNRYLGSHFGIIWPFVNPILTILIFWFVFTVGLKSAPVGNVPYIIWLSAGIVPWFFFSEAVVSGTSSVREYSYLVKKIVFQVNLLPLIKIFSTLIIHIFFLVLTFFLIIFYGMEFNIIWLQVIYYLFSMCTFLLGLCWLTSSANVFVKDIGQIMGIFINFCFWLTPIFWHVEQAPAWVKKVLLFNPAYYIVDGYRDSFINGIWFWDKPIHSIIFWIMSLALLFGGSFFFNKTKPHFADVI